MLEALLAAGHEPTTALYVFVLLTIVLGGGAAWRTGQAVAEGWGALWPVIAYTLLIAAAVRFLDYALFSGPLLSLATLDGRLPRPAASWPCSATARGARAT